MWKLRIGALLTSILVGLCLSPGAWANAGGDPNAGDVWLDNFAQAAGPGHEMDPHLACQDIDLWGSGLADGSGDFTIDGWAPSGTQKVAYSGSWSYTQPGDQPIATISVAKLIAGAQAAGDAAAAQGFHFKLDFSQDPQKHKTFWVDCPAGSPGGGGSTGAGSTGDGGSNGGNGSAPSGGTPTTGSVNTPPVTTSSVGGAKTSIGAVHIARKRASAHKRRKHRKLIHPKRHRKARRRGARAVRITDPSFTG